MKRNKNQITITAIIICLACAVSCIGQSYDKENGFFFGQDPEKELWAYGFSKKINPSKSPTNALAIARNTLMRYEINKSPLDVFTLVTNLSGCLGVEIEINFECPFLADGYPFWPKNLRWYEINYDKDSAAKGFIPWSKADERLKKAQNTKNAEEFLKTLFRHITWERNVIKVCPCGYDLQPPSEGALELMKQLEKQSKQEKCHCCK